MARFICGLCQKTIAEAGRGKDIVIVCRPCDQELRREVNSQSVRSKSAAEPAYRIRPFGRAA